MWGEEDLLRPSGVPGLQSSSIGNGAHTALVIAYVFVLG